VSSSVPASPLETGFNDEQGRFSPDGRWLAYVSNQSGVAEVYVRGVTTASTSGTVQVGPSVLVSRGGGTAPRWRGDGRELFFVATNGTMMAVDVTAGAVFKAGTPTPLFQTPPGSVVGDVAADGKRLLLVAPVGPTASVPFTVVLHWTTGLRR
jgi:dipeptidyl aminopeptidase/acylaminoacyl peptidase